jgi:hypothetical protein
MKKYLITLSAVLIASLVFTACSGDRIRASKNPEGTLTTKDDSVKRGEYLVTIMGCNDCHSPKRMSAQGPEIIPELILSGYPADKPMLKVSKDALNSGWTLFAHDNTAAAGPWGVSFAANLTPDQTGIGMWPEENFKRALTQGKFKGLEGSRQLLPPMPWTNFTNLSDADLKTIFIYLKNLKPVHNIVPAPLPPGN